MTEQRHNMPPDDLDLSQHVGKKAELWTGEIFPIEYDSTVVPWPTGHYPYIIGDSHYRKNGTMTLNGGPIGNNVKRIL